MGFDVYKNNYMDVKRRGGRIRLITEKSNFMALIKSKITLTEAVALH